jgi:hypothetical protein
LSKTARAHAATSNGGTFKAKASASRVLRSQRTR